MFALIAVNFFLNLSHCLTVGLQKYSSLYLYDNPLDGLPASAGVRALEHSLVLHVAVGIAILVPMAWFVVWHMKRALENSVTETELKGLITHVAFYAGWPCAVNAGRVLIEVCSEK